MKSLSRVWLFATPWTAAYQAPPSMSCFELHMQKELVLQFPKRKISLTSFNQQSHTHNHSEAITMLPLPWVPRSPYLLLPSWELQGGDQSPLIPVGVGPDWGLASGPCPILWPFLVSWSIPPMSTVRARPSGELECQCKREPGIPSGGLPPHSSQGSFTPARLSHQSGAWRGWRGWNLSGASRKVAETSNQENKHHTQRVGELRFITLAGPEELTLQALSPEPRGCCCC